MARKYNNFMDAVNITVYDSPITHVLISCNTWVASEKSLSDGAQGNVPDTIKTFCYLYHILIRYSSVTPVHRTTSSRPNMAVVLRSSA